MKHIRQSGYMLIEVLVAVTVIAVAMVAVVSRVSDAIAVNRLSQEQAVATRMAEEAVEWLKANRQDLGWNQFLSEFGLSVDGSIISYCWNDLPLTGRGNEACANNSVNMDETYNSRILTLYRNDVDTVEYNVTITWKFGSRDEQVSLSGKLHRGDYE